MSKYYSEPETKEKHEKKLIADAIDYFRTVIANGYPNISYEALRDINNARYQTALRDKNSSKDQRKYAYERVMYMTLIAPPKGSKPQDWINILQK